MRRPSKLNGYESVAVRQRRARTGCIPSGIEWMCRYMKALEEWDYTNFQERFDLAAQGTGSNDFTSIATNVSNAYPSFRWRVEQGFANGAAKVHRIREIIAERRPCLLSLSRSPTATSTSCPLSKSTSER